MKNKLLYVMENAGEQSQAFDNGASEICEFYPCLTKLYLKGERKTLVNTLVRIYFTLCSKGKARIYYVNGVGGGVCHTSYVLPKMRKFPFMEKGDYEIGPCYTFPEYRGRGIYPSVLKYITRINGNENSQFYMIVDEENHSSVRGIEKAGFRLCGRVKKTKFLKRYKLDECR